MHTEPMIYPTDPKSLYPLLRLQLQAMTEDVTDTIANLANASALMNLALRDINWVGFYLRRGEKLILGPFQGKPACVEIHFGRGVCGTAAETGLCQRVEDVHAFPGHIACDSASRSEIVLPLRKGGQVVAVLDIDSPSLARFTPEDETGLKTLIPILEAIL